MLEEELRYHERYTPFVRSSSIVLEAFRRKLARLWAGGSLQEGAPLMLVVEQGGEIVAMAENTILDVSLDDEPGFTPPGRYGCIDNVCVREELRGQGIGRLLVQAIFDAFAATDLHLMGICSGITRTTRRLGASGDAWGLCLCGPPTSDCTPQVARRVRRETREDVPSKGVLVSGKWEALSVMYCHSTYSSGGFRSWQHLMNSSRQMEVSKAATSMWSRLPSRSCISTLSVCPRFSSYA